MRHGAVVDADGLDDHPLLHPARRRIGNADHLHRLALDRQALDRRRIGLVNVEVGAAAPADDHRRAAARAGEGARRGRGVGVHIDVHVHIAARAAARRRDRRLAAARTATGIGRRRRRRLASAAAARPAGDRRRRGRRRRLAGVASALRRRRVSDRHGADKGAGGRQQSLDPHPHRLGSCIVLAPRLASRGPVQCCMKAQKPCVSVARTRPGVPQAVPS